MTLISVITPTWQRHDLLMNRCLPSVFAQTYSHIEHIVVSDGPDRVVSRLVAMDLWRRPRNTRPLVFTQLTERANDGGNFGARVRNHAAKLATGDLIAYLDDDNAYRPNHLQLLADALQANPKADFAYSRMIRHPREDEVGADPPSLGEIDTSLIMHRRDTLEKFGYWPVPGMIFHCPDWELIDTWIRAGAHWVFVPEITVDYYFS